MITPEIILHAYQPDVDVYALEERLRVERPTVAERAEITLLRICGLDRSTVDAAGSVVHEVIGVHQRPASAQYERADDRGAVDGGAALVRSYVPPGYLGRIVMSDLLNLTEQKERAAARRTLSGLDSMMRAYDVLPPRG